MARGLQTGTPQLAKITRPVFDDVLLRKRLFKELDRARKKPVLWISAPAGSGKTTLASSYIDDRELPCLWYQMDEGDSDLSTFFYYMGLAGKKAAPRRKKPLPLLTPEYMMGLPTFAKRFFEDLTARLRSPSVIVFDNYQEVPSTSMLHEVLTHGFSAIPEGITVMVLSRLPSPKVFARLRANAMMHSIHWDDIQFRENESRGLMKLHGATKLSAKASQEVHERAAGWAAGIVLLMQGGGKAVITDEHRSATFGDDIFNYFAEEIFERTDPSMKAFLLNVAFLPSMTSRMAGAMSGSDEAGRILQRLYRDNYFTDRRLGPEPTYQFHPLFKEFLLTRAEETFSEKELTDLREKAARILEDAGRYDEAGELLIEAKDWQELARLALTRAPSLAGQARFGVLEGWLERLPGDLVAQMPWLLYWKGVCRLPFEQKVSEEYFTTAFEGFSASGDAAGTFLSWSGIVDSIAWGFEDFARIDPWIPRFYEIIERFGSIPSEEIGDRVASSMYMALMHRKRDHLEFDKWAERALSQKGGDVSARAVALLLFSYDSVGAGDVARSERAMDLFKTLERSSDLPPLAQLCARQAMIQYFTLMARHRESLETVREAMEIARRTGVYVHNLLILGNGIVSALGDENVAEAERLLGEMTALVDGARPWDLSLYHFVTSLLALMQNRLAEARRNVDTAVALSAKVGASFSLASCYLLKAHVMHASGDDEKAADSIARARAIIHWGKSSLYEFMCLLALAEFDLDEDDRASAIRHLREAMALGRKEGYINSFYFWRKKIMSRLCAVALEEGIEVEYVRNLIRRRDLVPETPPLHIEDWPWPLKIYTLGRFSILKDDSPLRFSGRTQRKPVDMLKAIIALGGRGVPEGRVNDIFWPEAEGDAAHSNFSTTLSRLRKFLGSDEAVDFTDGCLSLDARRCWVDAWAFERGLSADKSKGISEDTVGSVEKALALYRGPFLAGDDEDWTISLRERLRRRFLQGLLDLGLFWEESGRWKKAVECYQRGLRVDDLAEELYQRLMSCYKELGYRGEALASYKQCERSLKRAFGVKPSHRTQTLYREIVKRGKEEKR
jgi:LuxR family maltose regulon positive regulatory protein